MSTGGAGKKKGAGVVGDKNEKSKPSSKEDSPAGAVKDDTLEPIVGGAAVSGIVGANGSPSAETSQPSSKPSSAGAVAREAAQKLLSVASRGEWSAADPLLKTLEKVVQSQGEDAHPPLIGLMDPVGFLTSFLCLFLIFNQ